MDEAARSQATDFLASNIPIDQQCNFSKLLFCPILEYIQVEDADLHVMPGGWQFFCLARVAHYIVLLPLVLDLLENSIGILQGFPNMLSMCALVKLSGGSSSVVSTRFVMAM